MKLFALAACVGLGVTTAASAQTWNDPCQPLPPNNVFALVIGQLQAQQRAIACQQARNAVIRHVAESPTDEWRHHLS